MPSSKISKLCRMLKVRGRILPFSNLARDESFENVKHYFCKLKVRGRILTFSNLARDESFENVQRKKDNLIWCECLCAN